MLSRRQTWRIAGESVWATRVRVCGSPDLQEKLRSQVPSRSQHSKQGKCIHWLNSVLRSTKSSGTFRFLEQDQDCLVYVRYINSWRPFSDTAKRWGGRHTANTAEYTPQNSTHHCSPQSVSDIRYSYVNVLLRWDNQRLFRPSPMTRHSITYCMDGRSLLAVQRKRPPIGRIRAVWGTCE